MRRLVLLALVGLVAQLIDGSLGMGYGATSATLLVAAGIGPAAASAAIHFSEIGTSLVSGLSHHKLGNTDWRTVGVLALPGFAGALAGAASGRGPVPASSPLSACSPARSTRWGAVAGDRSGRRRSSPRAAWSP